MRRISLPLLLVATAALVAAPGCSDDPAGTQYPDGYVREAGLVLDFRAADLGELPDGRLNDPGSPTIQILSPKKNEVVIGSTYKVRAKVIDPDGVKTVKMFLKGTQGLEMSLGTEADIYEGLLDFAGITGTAFYLGVAACDINDKCREAYVRFDRDPGPQIQIVSPKKDQRFKSKAPIQVRVADAKGIKSFQLRLGSYVVQVTNKSSDPKLHNYVGEVKFDDKAFVPPLSGKQVLKATATNQNNATASATRGFVVDDKGPTISVQDLAAGQLVGGILELKASVTDLAGVSQSSVQVVIGNKYDTRKVQLTPASSGSSTFTGVFDTRTLDQLDLWPVVSFRAADTLGNESHQDLQVGLDNGQPIVELDPPEDFFLFEKDKGNTLCSEPFDPVGALAADDLDKVPQIQEFRVRIEDQGNHVPSAVWIPISTVDKATVWLYVLDDTTKPLVVDTDGDGYCDDINPKVIPLGSKPLPGEAVAINLVAVSPTGTVDFNVQSSASLGMPPGCDSWGTAKEDPDPLCYSTASTTTVVHSYTTKTEPAIYTIPPVAAGSTGYKCLGLPFDFKANNFTNGWACAAAVADDKLGSRGVSPPIRIMVDKSWNSKVSAKVNAATAATAPGCLGTLDKKTGMVTNVPCTFRDIRNPGGSSTWPPPSASCGSDSTLRHGGYCSNCAKIKFGDHRSAVQFPQTFGHCQVYEK